MKKYKIRILIIAVICIYAMLFTIVKNNNSGKEYSDYEYQKKVQKILDNEKGQELEDSEMEGHSVRLFLEQKSLLLDIMTTDEMFIVDDKVLQGVKFIEECNGASYDDNKEKIKYLFNIDNEEQYQTFQGKIHEFKDKKIEKVIITQIDENKNFNLELRTSSNKITFNINVVFGDVNLKEIILTWN